MTDFALKVLDSDGGEMTGSAAVEALRAGRAVRIVPVYAARPSRAVDGVDVEVLPWRRRPGNQFDPPGLAWAGNRRPTDDEVEMFLQAVRAGALLIRLAIEKGHGS